MVSNWDEILPASKQHWDEKVITWDESSKGKKHWNDLVLYQVKRIPRIWPAAHEGNQENICRFRRPDLRTANRVRAPPGQWAPTAAFSTVGIP